MKKHPTRVIPLVLSLFFLANSTWANDFDPQSLVVKVKEEGMAPRHSLIRSAKHLFGNYYVVWTDHLKKVEADLKHSPLIVSVEKNHKSDKRNLGTETPIPTWELGHLGQSREAEKEIQLGTFNDPYTNKQWLLRDAAQHGISVNKAYEESQGTKEEVIVAVVDSGVDYNHEDLKDVMWTNAQEIPGNGVDDDQNGYVDDYYGINTLVRNSQGQASGNPMASHGHGTHVAGIIAAQQNNQLGIAGVASQVKIMAIRTVPDDGDETDVNVSESFLYAAKHGAKIINCSFGKRVNEGGMLVSDTIKHIGETYGTLVVAAAGNESQDVDVDYMYPASFANEHLLVVASSTSSGSFSYFTNFGVKNVDLAAPGSSIFSTWPRNRYSNLSGTSMASPAAAGVAAEVLSQFPELSPLELKDILIRSVTKVPSFEGRVLSGGRIDLHQALSLANQEH